MIAKTFALYAAVVLALQLPTASFAESLQDKLFQRALQGTKCEQVPSNGRYCTYQFGNTLEFGIKDVGGADTVIGFHNSNIKNELYAVIYYGCIVVVPGKAHPKNYGREYGVSISPKTGLVYQIFDNVAQLLNNEEAIPALSFQRITLDSY